MVSANKKLSWTITIDRVPIDNCIRPKIYNAFRSWPVCHLPKIIVKEAIYDDASLEIGESTSYQIKMCDMCREF